MLLLNEDAVLQCVHGARLMLEATQTFVKAGGRPLLTAPAPAGATIAGSPARLIGVENVAAVRGRTI